MAYVAALVLCLLLATQCKGDIQLGQTLKVGESWVSAGSTFAIGFNNATTTPGMYNLAIWYNLVKLKTVVWTAKANDGTQTVQASRNAQLVLQKNGLLVKDGTQTLWQTQGTSCVECVTSANMLESGNFVLLDDNSKQGSVWQSFSSPTDTLLPNQQLVGNMKLAAGKYSLHMSKVEVALQYQDYLAQPYWTITNSNLNISDPSLKTPPRLNLSSTGLLTFYDGNGSSWYRSKFENSQIHPLDYGSIVTRRLTLESSGNLLIYSLAPKNDSWQKVWEAKLLECDIHGACGAFGLCTYRPQKTCNCPPGFRRVDQNDGSAGCTYNVPLQCNASNKLIQLGRADYAYNDYNPDQSPVSVEDCKNSCLNDCKCLAAAYKFEGSGLCFLKGDGGKLYNGVQAASVNNLIFLKVSASDTSAKDPPATDSFITDVNATTVAPISTVKYVKDGKQLQHSVLLPIAIAEFVLFAAVGIISCICWRRKVRRMWQQQYGVDIEGAPTRFSYEQLQVATDNFSQRLGSGAFGTVYSGVLPDKTLVAVKQLEVATQGEKQFHAEVATIGRIHHINLVRLLGYCAEGRHRLLVLEYMPSGSLEKILFSEKGSFFCDWNTRFAIALGIARGITYLHEECHECILHCDIKPQNILLDQNFCPKVADFGLAKLVKRDNALSVTTIRGTRGYLAPEWISNLPITAKVDVYSFGMVLLEIISGRDNFMFTSSAMNSDRWYFPLWAFQKYIAADLPSIADPKLAGDVDWGQFERVLKVAFWCIQPDASSRPTMSRVVQMLEDSIQVPEPPFPRLLEDDISKLRSSISRVRQDLSSSDVLRTGRW